MGGGGGAGAGGGGGGMVGAGAGGVVGGVGGGVGGGGGAGAGGGGGGMVGAGAGGVGGGGGGMVGAGAGGVVGGKASGNSKKVSYMNKIQELCLAAKGFGGGDGIKTTIFFFIAASGGSTNEEIAEGMNKPIGTVKAAIQAMKAAGVVISEKDRQKRKVVRNKVNMDNEVVQFILSEGLGWQQ